jgi:hypothetical protein
MEQAVGKVEEPRSQHLTAEAPEFRKLRLGLTLQRPIPNA